ncbi:hypothetical protein KKF32_01360 [Patescibacteria group bacterium]|nr:hypothetical protein [Patescibacteria group bacterium]
MLKVLKGKISPILAFLLILIFGYFSITLMQTVFEEFAHNEMLIKKYEAEIIANSDF